MSVPPLIVSFGSLYLEAGALVALLFAFGFVGRVEPSAAGGSALFRLLILPGATLLWPLILVRTVRVLRSKS
jgi:hypothetical protein